MKTRAAKLSNKLHPTQLAYAAAKATYDANLEAYRVACAERGATFIEGASSAEDDVVLDLQEQIHVELEMTRIFEELRAAEEAMVARSSKHTAAIHPDHAATIADTVKRARGSAKHWPRVVDLAFRLACPVAEAVA